MASFEILLISVRSDTPTSFFFVVSNTARLICPLPEPPLERPESACLPASFLRPARFVTAYRNHKISFLLKKSFVVRAKQRERLRLDCAGAGTYHGWPVPQ